MPKIEYLGPLEDTGSIEYLGPLESPKPAGLLDKLKSSLGGFSTPELEARDSLSGTNEGQLLVRLLKAIPRVGTETVGGLAVMPYAGLRGLSSGLGALITGEDPMAASSEEVNRIMGKVGFTQTPEEKQAVENLMLAMKPFQMAGKGWAGLAELPTGGLQGATDVIEGRSGGSNIAVPIAGTIGETSAMFSLPEALRRARTATTTTVERPFAPLENVLAPTETPIVRPPTMPEIDPRGIIQQAAMDKEAGLTRLVENELVRAREQRANEPALTALLRDIEERQRAEVRGQEEARLRGILDRIRPTEEQGAAPVKERYQTLKGTDLYPEEIRMPGGVESKTPVPEPIPEPIKTPARPVEEVLRDLLDKMSQEMKVGGEGTVREPIKLNERDLSLARKELPYYRARVPSEGAIATLTEAAKQGKLQPEEIAVLDKIKGRETPVVEPEIVQPKATAAKEAPVDYYRGGDAASAMPKGKTAQDVVNYETKELGNDIKPEPGIDLKSIPSDNLQWLTEGEAAAKEYGVTNKQEGNFKVIARDNYGGVLVETIKDIQKSEVPKDYQELGKKGVEARVNGMTFNEYADKHPAVVKWSEEQKTRGSQTSADTQRLKRARVKALDDFNKELGKKEIPAFETDFIVDTAFHGTSSLHAKGIREKGFLPPDKHGMPTATVQPNGISLTIDPKVAKDFGESVSNFTKGSKPEVLEVDTSKLKIFNDPKDEWLGHNNYNDFIEDIKKKGYDAVRNDTGEGEIYVFNIDKLKLKAPPPATPKAIAPDVEFALHEMRSALESGEAGGMKGMDEATNKPIFKGSGYPEWFTGLVKRYGSAKTSPSGKAEGISAKDAINVINKKLEGKDLTYRQNTLYLEIERAANKEIVKGEYSGIIEQYMAEIGKENPDAWTKGKLEGEGIKGERVLKNEEHLKGRILDEIKAEGLVEKEDAALAELDDYFKSVSETPAAKTSPKLKVTEETAEIPGTGMKDNFNLVNPETKIGRLPEESKTKTGGLFEKDDTTLTSGIDISKTKEVLSSIKGKLSDSMVGKTARGLGEELHSPDVVLAKDPAHGTPIYKIADKATTAKSKFMETEGKTFHDVISEGKIKSDSPASQRVGQALDGTISPAELIPSERKVYDFFKEKYHFLLQEAAKKAAGDQATYTQALNLANRKVKPAIPVKELSTGDLAKYKKLDNARDRIDFLHERWKETQPEGLVKSYDLLSREIKDYLPHIFDKETLTEAFQVEINDINNKLRTATDQGAVTGYKTRLKELETAVKTIQGGGFVRYEALPRNIRFKFFESRKGKEGYSFDAVKAYQTYLTGIARKMFDEPALKAMAVHYDKLSPDLKPYADWYIKRFAGIGKKSKLEDFANAVASFQWIRTLGFNPRSAIVNLTQRVNTVADVGFKYSAKGEQFAFTKEGKKLFDETGIAAEVPQVLYEGGAPKWEKLRSIAGFMFNKIEMGNRRHAFLSGYLKAIDELKMTPTEAVQYGMDTVHKTQFRYGRVGMPKAMTSPMGRIGLQFSSYPIKQFELLSSWAKNEPAKLIKFLAMAEGGNYALQQWLDTDLSNALGIGVNWGEALNVIKDASTGDIREAFRHTRLVLNPGGGLLPSGPGPTVTSAMKIAGAIPEGKGAEALKTELMPVVAKRGIQAYEAVKGEKGGKYPIMSQSGHPSVKLTGRELIQRTIGPRTETERKTSQDIRVKSSLEKDRKAITHDIIKMYIDGDIKGAKALVKESGIIPTPKQIDDERMKQKYTREETAKLKARLTKSQEYQLRKEGKVYY